MTIDSVLHNFLVHTRGTNINLHSERVLYNYTILHSSNNELLALNDDGVIIMQCGELTRINERYLIRLRLLCEKLGVGFSSEYISYLDIPLVEIP